MPKQEDDRRQSLLPENEDELSKYSVTMLFDNRTQRRLQGQRLLRGFQQFDFP